MDGAWGAAINAMKDPVFLLDEDSRIISCNDAAEDFLGVGRNRFLGEHCYKHVHKCDQPVENCAFQKMLKTKKREVFVLEENGEFLEVAVDPATHSDSPSLRAIHIIRNVTLQKKNEETLTLFRNLLDHGNDSIYFVDPETGRFIDANDKACQELGYTHDELLNLTVLDLEDIFDDIDVWKSHMDDLRGTSGMIINGVHKRKDGSSFDVEVSTRYASIAGRDVVVAIARDISEKKRIYDKLGFLSAIVEQVKDTIIVMDENFKITYVNDAGIELYGYEKEELIGQTPDEIIAGQVTDGAAQEIARTLKKGLPYSAIGRHRKKNGREFFCESKTTPMYDENGNAYYVSICRDVSDLVSAEKAKRKMQEQEKDALVGKVAGKAAHDFNNILGIILGTTQLMLMDAKEPPLVKDLEVIRESAIMGREITRNLVFFAKDQEPKFSLLDLNQKVELILSTFAADLKHIELNASFMNETEEIMADSNMIQSAIINLLRNSMDAVSLAANPKISVRTGNENGCVFIEFEDNGCGIPPEYVRNVFEPAFTLKGSADRLSAYKSGIKGSGYGLANVKRTIDKHRGEITVKSDPEAKTVFRISIPVMKEKVSISEFRRFTEGDVLMNKRVLIVEDEPHLAKVLASILSSLNHTTDIAADGETALEYMHKFNYDIVSLDYMLPDMDGMEVYNAIRKKNRAIPIVFVSGNFEFIRSIYDLEKEDPRAAHLSKPFDNVEYAKMINQCISNAMKDSSS